MEGGRRRNASADPAIKISLGVFAFCVVVFTIAPTDSHSFPGIAAQIIPTLLIALGLEARVLGFRATGERRLVGALLATYAFGGEFAAVTAAASDNALASEGSGLVVGSIMGLTALIAALAMLGTPELGDDKADGKASTEGTGH